MSFSGRAFLAAIAMSLLGWIFAYKLGREAQDVGLLPHPHIKDRIHDMFNDEDEAELVAPGK
jgi:hypothetical protein